MAHYHRSEVDDGGPGLGVWPMVGAAALAALGLGLVGWGVAGLPEPAAPVLPPPPAATSEPPVAVVPEAGVVTPEAERETFPPVCQACETPPEPPEAPIAAEPAPGVLRKTDEAEAAPAPEPEPFPVDETGPRSGSVAEAPPPAAGPDEPPAVVESMPEPAPPPIPKEMEPAPRYTMPPRPRQPGERTPECRNLVRRYALEPIGPDERAAVAAEMRIVCDRPW